jgi:hypothetical protein
MTLFSKAFLLVLGSALMLGGGCAKDPGPPPPLVVEQIGPELDKAFKEAKAEPKELVAKVNSSLQAKDYTIAYDAIQALCSLPDATKEQRSLSARAMLTIHGLLQEAQAQGDEKAGAALRYHQSTK